MPHLCDVNVLLALCHAEHRHHEVARSWMDAITEPRSVGLCRVTQLALLRLLNNPVVLGGDAWRGRDVWRITDLLLEDDRFTFHTEPPEVGDALRRFTEPMGISLKAWSDAYLAAFAQTAHLTLVSFDRGFRQYAGLETMILG